MSKELIEELNEQVLTYDEWAREKCTEKLAIDRIEELERERDGWKASAENRLEIQGQRERRIEELELERNAFYMDYRMKCDEETKALLADNARLREALRFASEELRTKDPE